MAPSPLPAGQDGAWGCLRVGSLSTAGAVPRVGTWGAQSPGGPRGAVGNPEQGSSLSAPWWEAVPMGADIVHSTELSSFPGHTSRLRSKGQRGRLTG